MLRTKHFTFCTGELQFVANIYLERAESGGMNGLQNVLVALNKHCSLC